MNLENNRIDEFKRYLELANVGFDFSELSNYDYVIDDNYFYVRKITRKKVNPQLKELKIRVDRINNNVSITEHSNVNLISEQKIDDDTKTTEMYIEDDELVVKSANIRQLKENKNDIVTFNSINEMVDYSVAMCTSIGIKESVYSTNTSDYKKILNRN